MIKANCETIPATTPALTRHPSLKRRGKQQYLPLSALQAEERGLNGYDKGAVKCIRKWLETHGVKP